MEIQPIRPQALFLEPDRNVSLEWKVEHAGDQTALRYAVTDYWDRPVATGIAKAAGAGRFVTELTLPRGYYSLRFEGVAMEFGLCALAPFAGNPDLFFSIDAAISWLEKRPEVRPALLDILRRTGIHGLRERTQWAGVHPSPDQFDFQTPAEYESWRKACAAAGLKLMEMFHDAPEWMGAINKRFYPADLVAAGRSWAAIARRWHALWEVFEVWNEPDIHVFGGNLPADQFVSFVKAVVFALHQAGIHTPIGGGVFTEMAPPEFHRSCAQNGLLDLSDFVSFHSYFPADKMQEKVASYRQWLATSGKPTMPLWITECGRYAPGTGAGRMVLEQDVQNATQIVSKAVEARACGIARYYAFVYPYYEENGNCLGMMDKATTPQRAMAAYAFATAALSHKPYIGDVSVTDATVQCARAFEDGGRTLLVLYTGDAKADAAGKLSLPAPAEVRGIDGRRLALREDGAIPTADGVTYLWFDSARIASRIQRDSSAMQLLRTSHEPKPVRPAPSPIVLQHLLPKDRTGIKSIGYAADAAGRYILKVRVNNLGSDPADVSLRLNGPSLSRRARRTVAPSAWTDVNWRLDLGRALAVNVPATLVVTAETAGRVVAPLAFDVLPQDKQQTVDTSTAT